MFKKDPIFWWASGIFILALLLFAMTQNQLWLALMIGSYLLRPTLASLGVAKRYVDERQLSLHYRSSNIAFVIMIIACVIFAAKLNAEGNHAWEIFNMIIIIGLAVKALFNVVLAKNLREGATKIIIAAGLLITLFAGMDSLKQGFLGLIMNLMPGLAIIGLGILSRYFPRLIAVFVFLITIALEIVIFSKGLNWAQIGTAFIVGVPLLIAGVCLYLPDKSEIRVTPELCE
jgi:low affinity Fe/Cu permease